MSTVSAEIDDLSSFFPRCIWPSYCWIDLFCFSTGTRFSFCTEAKLIDSGNPEVGSASAASSPTCQEQPGSNRRQTSLRVVPHARQEARPDMHTRIRGQGGSHHKEAGA